MKYLLLKSLVIFILFILLILIQKKTNNLVYSYDDSTYFTTWATAIYEAKPPPIKLNNNSIRQIIKVSSGGEKIRIKFSNILGKTKLELKGVSIADVINNSEINLKSIKY
jgi:hypothetical protein